MWQKIFKSKPSCTFVLMAVKKNWQLDASKTQPKGFKQITALLLFCMHYGIINTLRKLFYKFTEACFNYSFEQRKIKQVCDQFGVLLRIIDAPFGREFEQSIKDIAPDIILYQSHCKLDEQIIKNIPYGVVNRHPSLLPEFRGCFPLFWAKAYKDFSNIGVTLFRMDKHYDTGDVLAKTNISVREQDSLKKIYKRTYAVGADMIIKLLTSLEAQETILAKKQEEKGSYYGWPSLKQVLKVACFGRL